MQKYLICLYLAALAVPALASDPIEQNKAIVRRVVEEILGQGKFELTDQLYAKDFVNHGQSRDYTLKEDQDGAGGWRQAFPDLKMTVEKLVAEGDLVTVLWRARGTNSGAGFGLPATGKPVELRGITIWRVVDGKIREEWSAFDQHLDDAATRIAPCQSVITHFEVRSSLSGCRNVHFGRRIPSFQIRIQWIPVSKTSFQERNPLDSTLK